MFYFLTLVFVVPINLWKFHIAVPQNLFLFRIQPFSLSYFDSFPSLILHLSFHPIFGVLQSQNSTLTLWFFFVHCNISFSKFFCSLTLLRTHLLTALIVHSYSLLYINPLRFSSHFLPLSLLYTNLPFFDVIGVLPNTFFLYH